MISAERLLAYGSLHPEASLETPPGVHKPPKSWPDQGGIRLLGMKFRYSADTPYVLKDVSVDIKPREKVRMYLSVCMDMECLSAMGCWN